MSAILARRRQALSRKVFLGPHGIGLYLFVVIAPVVTCSPKPRWSLAGAIWSDERSVVLIELRAIQAMTLRR
jgi:hypothetical protein